MSKTSVNTGSRRIGDSSLVEDDKYRKSEEAFQGTDWKIDDTSQTLRAVEEVVFVGVYSGDRLKDYTHPGYEAYARSLAEEVVPMVEQSFRVTE